MGYRTKLINRPWLTGARYDKATGRDTVHFDLFAYTDVLGDVYFEVQTTQSGKHPLAWDGFKYEPMFGLMTRVPINAFPEQVGPLVWRRDNHAMFRRVHPRLLMLTRTLPFGCTARSILAHYVARPDADPWPRSTVNTWRPAIYGAGKRPGRPRKARPEPAPALPDVL